MIETRLDYVPNYSRPLAIFDLDGTLRNHQHRLHLVTGKKRDYEQYRLLSELDTPNWDICKIYLSMLRGEVDRNGQTYDVQIWTGHSFNPSEIRLHPYAWLEMNLDPTHTTEILPHVLKMRDYNDRTKDHVIKARWLDEELTNGRDLKKIIVFEDRPTVVDMWLNKGVRCVAIDQLGQIR